MPRYFVTGYGKCVEHRSEVGATRGGGTEADCAGGDEDGDRGDGSGFGGGGNNALLGGHVGFGGAEAGDDSEGRVMKIDEIYDRIEGEPLGPVWISLVPRE